jgi:TPR repeat protein
VTRSEAFSLLEQAANQGDLEAKTVFAINAPTYADILQQEGTNEAAAHAARLRKRAEALAEEASKAGSEEAMSFLSRAYLTGTLGNRDAEKAYMYLLALTKRNESQAATELLQSVSRHLSASQRTKAEAAALGCGQANANTFNPFTPP